MHAGQRLQGRSVHPLGIVDDADDGAFASSVSEQSQHGQTHQKSIGHGTFSQAQGNPQRLALGRGYPVDAPHQRGAQLLHAGIGKLHLRFSTADGDGVKVGGRGGGRVGEQCRLSDACVTPQNQDAAASLPGPREHSGKNVSLASAPQQPHAWSLPAHARIFPRQRVCGTSK